MAEGAEHLAGVTEGQILAGKFRVERVLGVGGMGAVVAAHHLHLDEKVALKFLLPATLANPESVTRFAREARNAVKIKSEHVARVLDVGTLDNGAPYMVMEFLEGVDLSTLLKRQGPMPVEQAVDFILQASEAIAEAHALGIVHRDLKPANLFCVQRGESRPHIKVLDFGISKVTRLGGSAGDPAVTKTASLLGTPLYMSPEQLESSSAVDARSDLWALGVVLFELLTGTVPFGGESIGEVSLKIAVRPPASLRELRPDAPDGLERVLRKCLEKRPEHRHQNIAELATALLPFGSNRAKTSVERVTDIVQGTGLGTETLASSSSVDRRSGHPPANTIAPLGSTAGRSAGAPRTRTGLVASIGALAAVALALGTWFWVAPRHEPSGTASPPNATASPATPLSVEPSASKTYLPLPVEALPKVDPPVPEPEIPPMSPPESSSKLLPVKPAKKATSAGGAASDLRPSKSGHASSSAVSPNAATAGSVEPTADPAKKNDCDPNYEIDPASGAHKFKPWCFKDSK